MKRAVWVGFVLLSMLVANTGAAWAGSAIELISVTNGGGGPTFTFRVSGEFSPNELKGSGHISGGDDFGLECAKQDETTVVCHAPKKASGQAVSVTFGGATFWTDVPEQKLGGGGGGSTQYCYSLWANHQGTIVYPQNYYLGDVVTGQAVDYTTGNVVYFGAYQDFGPICQDAPANEHDIVVMDIGGGYKTFGFFDPAPSCPPDHGSAYYSRFSIVC